MAGEIRTERVLLCPVCGSGESLVLYTNLKDRLFNAPGEWSFKECRNCGTAFLDPRLTPEDIGKAYETYYTHSASEKPKSNSPVHRFYRALKVGYLGKRWGYSERAKPWQSLLGSVLYLHPGRRAQLDHTVMYLEAAPGERLLDVGCGSGELMARMQDLGWRVEGVDFDAMAVQAARESGLKVRLGTLEEQPYPDGHFEAITMSHVIEHVHEPLALLSECHRILEPGGRIIVVTPNIRSLCHRRFRTDWRGLEPPRHLQVMAPSALLCLAQGAGFQNFSIWTSMQSADFMYVASTFIKRTGVHSEDEAASRFERLRGRLMQHQEWAMLKVRADVGEEIVAVLEK